MIYFNKGFGSGLVLTAFMEKCVEPYLANIVTPIDFGPSM
jgi:hypothetical protein